MLKGFLSAPWFVALYFFAFALFTEINWKIGVGWLLWRIAHNVRITWEKKILDNAIKEEK